jgi:drug/metabolite transporter (DMT)-like permease
MAEFDKTGRALLIIGTVFGVLAAFGWAAGFVAAKHGIEIGFTPADLAFHRFFWSSLLLLPMAWRAGLKDLGGVGWRRGIVVTVLSGPTQAMIAYVGFIIVPLGHGTTIQPATAALSGLILAALVLGESVSPRRMLGAAAIVAGLVIYGAESLTTIGSHGVVGDLLFATAGLGWAMFGVLVRKWHLNGMRALGAVAVFSVFFFAPIYFLVYGIGSLARQGWWENLLQAVVQGVLAGALPIYLFSHAVFALGAGRAGTFPAVVPVFGVLIGFLALGVVPTWMQLVGLVVVLVGFQFTLRR